MADGNQHGFNFPRTALTSALRPGEIVLDFFAGGGGASEALRQALGRDPDVAVNHDPMAIGMHAANHPFTHHMQADVWTVDILREVANRNVGWFHASPDCTHFSQAKGGQPRSRATRSLSWVVLKVAGTLAAAGLAPRIISLENVEQILTWGPLVAKRCKATGRVLKLDGSVAAKGEQVSVWDQQLVPDKRRAGHTWAQFVAALRAIGYAVECRKLVASDYGAGTSRKRLFLIARRDGQPIVWPAPTHGKAPGLLPLVTAADCIDFTVPCPSIFTRKKPLAEATMRRIAKGIQRYVIDAAEPFIVGCGGRMGQTAERGVSQPMQTITAKADSCFGTATLAPLITEMANATNQRTMRADEPLRTICAGVKGGHFAVVAAFLEQACGGYYNGAGQDFRRPAPTICAKGSIQRLVTAQLEEYEATDESNRGSNRVGALRGTFGRNDLATEAARPQQQREHGEASPRRAEDAERLSGDKDGRGQKAALGVCAQAGLDGTSRPNPGRNADQSPRRQQNQQFSRESGTGDSFGEHPARLRHGSENQAAEHPCAENAPGQGRGKGTPVAGHELRGDCEKIGDISDACIQGRALRVAAFLTTYYGNGQAVDVREPLDTVTTRDRMALVTVHLHGVPYVITDIRLRMLKPAELFRAQGFPSTYIIDRTADGRKITTTAAVRMVGNSVSPPPLFALARANLDVAEQKRREAA